MSQPRGMLSAIAHELGLPTIFGPPRFVMGGWPRGQHHKRAIRKLKRRRYQINPQQRNERPAGTKLRREAKENRLGIRTRGY